jgi:hypothetical protein
LAYALAASLSASCVCALSGNGSASQNDGPHRQRYAPETPGKCVLMLPGNQQSAAGLARKSCRGKFSHAICGGLAQPANTSAVSLNGNSPKNVSSAPPSLQAEHVRLQV